MDLPAGVSVDAPREGVSVVALEGEHDLGTVPQVRDALNGVTASGNSVVVDLCPAKFVDSSILGAILTARREALDAGLGFGVACDGKAEPVRRVLEVTGLDSELPVHGTLDSAIEAAAAKPSSR